ncbi:MAG: AraC family transcriptional regulator [Treponemataceae bacterium]|nr:AraC family transcriptional regulator [Treponemataceae bacterium]
MNDDITIAEARKAYLSLLYHATYMPMYYLVEQNIAATFPQWTFPFEELLAYKNAITLGGITIDYFAIDDILFMGIVRNRNLDEAVVIGPISLSELTPAVIQKCISGWQLDEESQKQATAFLERTPSFSLHQFLAILVLINRELNGETLRIEDVYKETMPENIGDQIAKEHSASLLERKERANYHDTYYFEQEYYALIEKGDVEGLKNLLQSMPPFTEGAVGSNSLRQAKNIFISSITNYTRYAIAGGLDIETAYQLSDTYIQTMEKMADVNGIILLNNTAVFDFTQRVADAGIPQGLSGDIFRCVQYIANHSTEGLSVEELAEELTLNRSTLSKKFQREMGISISGYIMKRKLEEARNLLTYTDKTCSEISAFLYFSSQAYFQNVFKKQYGITPREYRMQHHASRR